MKQKILIILFLIFPINTFALVLGEDGLYEEPWIIETFKDLREDLEEANQEQKRFMILFEQKGCGYCKKMHEKVLWHATDVSEKKEIKKHFGEKSTIG